MGQSVSEFLFIFIECSENIIRAICAKFGFSVEDKIFAPIHFPGVTNFKRPKFIGTILRKRLESVK